jgi:sugar lactone lactonase YvrE
MTTATVLADGIFFGEGPRWHDGRLWFSDFYEQAVKTCTEDGQVEIAVRTPHRPSGLGWLPDGRLIMVSMQDRKLLRREANGDLVTHADLNGVATWHCNDMVVDAKGRAYVGNFGFDLETAFQTREIPDILAHHDKADLAFVDTDGTVSVAAKDMDFPNGSVITPDGKTLIVGETMGFVLTAFDIADDGSLSNRRTWAALEAGRAADGICLDADGQIWVANPFGPEAFRVAEGGAVTATVTTSQPCYACMLGGADGQTLFALTAASASEHEAAASRTGKIEVARVDSPRAGRP